MAEIDQHEQEITTVIEEKPDPVPVGVASESSPPVNDSFNNAKYYEYQYTGHSININIPTDFRTGEPLAIWRSVAAIPHLADNELQAGDFKFWYGLTRNAFLVPTEKEKRNQLRRDRAVFLTVDELAPPLSREAEVHRWHDGSLSYLFVVQSTINVQGSIMVTLDDSTFIAPVEHNPFDETPPVYMADPTLQSSLYRPRMLIDLGSPEREFAMDVPRMSSVGFDYQRWIMDCTVQRRSEKVDFKLPYDKESAAIFAPPPCLVFSALGPIQSLADKPGVVRLQIWYKASSGFRMTGRIPRPISHIQLGTNIKSWRLPLKEGEDAAQLTAVNIVDKLTTENFKTPSNMDVMGPYIRPDSAYTRDPEVVDKADKIPVQTFNKVTVLPPITPKI